MQINGGSDEKGGVGFKSEDEKAEFHTCIKMLQGQRPESLLSTPRQCALQCPILWLKAL
jgi:hypothetical protein